MDRPLSARPTVDPTGLVHRISLAELLVDVPDHFGAHGDEEMVTDLQVPRHTRLHVCQRGVTGDHVGELDPAVDNLELSLRSAPHPDAVKLRRIAVKDGAAVGVGIASHGSSGSAAKSRSRTVASIDCNGAVAA